MFPISHRPIQTASQCQVDTENQPRANTRISVYLLAKSRQRLPRLFTYLTSCIYRLVDTRLVAGRPTIYTSNIQAQQTLNARYGEKVGSRLFGECEILRFYGEDLRLIRRG